jgi:hypothetical protein
MGQEGEATFANAGFSAEFARALIASGGARGPVEMGRLNVLPHDPVAFAAVSDRFCAAERNLTVWAHSELVAAEASGDSVGRIEIICAGRRETVVPSVCVDTTGDGTLGRLAGGESLQERSERLQRPSYIALIEGLEPDALSENGRLRAAHALAGAAVAGDLPGAVLGAAFRPGVREGSAYLTIDLDGGGEGGATWDPLSPASRALAERMGRDLALKIVAFLGGQIEGWTRSRIGAWPSRLGVRESVRLLGVHELTGEEVLIGERFADGVVEVAWPIELRERATGPRWRYPEGAVAARVPLRSLRHRDLVNLWMAGRCLSATHEALGAVRVMGTCLATGEIAGLSAAAFRGEAVGADSDWQTAAARVTEMRGIF